MKQEYIDAFDLATEYFGKESRDYHFNTMISDHLGDFYHIVRHQLVFNYIIKHGKQTKGNMCYAWELDGYEAGVSSYGYDGIGGYIAKIGEAKIFTIERHVISTYDGCKPYTEYELKMLKEIPEYFDIIVP